MGIESIVVSKALPDGDFGQKAVIDAHRYMAPRIHRRHSSVGAVHRAIPKFRRLHLLHAKRPPRSGFVQTGLWEVMTRIPENIKSNQDPPGLA